MIELDDIDRKILLALRDDGRLPILNLAEKIGLSPTPCGRRVKRMEEAGVIQGYTARIAPQALGQNINVFVSVRLGQHGPEGTEQFLAAIAARQEITECLLVTGAVDYVLRVGVSDVDALGTFIRDVLQSIPSVAETSTMVILKQGANLLEARGRKTA